MPPSAVDLPGSATLGGGALRAPHFRLLRPSTSHALRIAARGADPWVVRHQGVWYYTHTSPGGSQIEIFMGGSLDDLGQTKPTVLFTPNRDAAAARKNMWAPEFHQLNGRWYVYFAADNGRNANHRMFVLESKDGIRGPYNFLGPVTAPGHDRWAIDGTVLTLNGSHYFIWSGWPGKKNCLQNLYIARMKSPRELIGEPVCISTPDHPWEAWINEGPTVLVRDNRVFVVYSAERSWTDSYCLGLLSLPPGEDPLNPRAWRKSPEPVFQSVTTGPAPVYAPGHCCFVNDPEEDVDWIVYHVAVEKGSGWKRETRAQRFSWGADGLPNFGSPLSLQDQTVGESIRILNPDAI